MLRSLLAPSAFAVALIAAAGAHAQTDEERALLACGEAFQACESRCESSYVDDAAAEAGCVAACAADRAVCEAKSGYEQAKPWVADQFRKMQRFFEGFSEQGRDHAPPPSSRPEPLIPPQPEEAPAPAPEDDGPLDL